MYDVNRMTQIKAPMPPKDNSLERTSTYTVDGKSFIVTPVFQQESGESLGSVLLKLMTDDP